MKFKKVLLLIIIFSLSLTLMGCPKLTNSKPEFKLNEDGELVDINHIDYEYAVGSPFDPQDMVKSLIENSNLVAIDYDQGGFIWGKDRTYVDISDRIEAISFYDVWSEGDDANEDGVVNSLDEEYYGLIKTDEDGKKLYDADKIMLVRIGAIKDFILKVVDDEGGETELAGSIVSPES